MKMELLAKWLVAVGVFEQLKSRPCGVNKTRISVQRISKEVI